jgi:hypothetical protein
MNDDTNEDAFLVTGFVKGDRNADYNKRLRVVFRGYRYIHLTIGNMNKRFFLKAP